MRFIGRHNSAHLWPGVYIAIRAEPHRRGDPTPEMPADAELTINDRPATVLASTYAEIVFETGGATWRCTPLKPSEMRNYPVHWEPGIGTREWVIRERVDEISSPHSGLTPSSR